MECRYADCSRQGWTRGLCKACYQRLRKSGELDIWAKPSIYAIPQEAIERAERVRRWWLKTPFENLPGHIQDRFWECLEVLGVEACQVMAYEALTPERMAALDAAKDRKTFAEARAKQKKMAEASKPKKIETPEPQKAEENFDPWELIGEASPSPVKEECLIG